VWEGRETQKLWFGEGVKRASEHSGGVVVKKDWSKHTMPY